MSYYKDLDMRKDNFKEQLLGLKDQHDADLKKQLSVTVQELFDINKDLIETTMVASANSGYKQARYLVPISSKTLPKPLSNSKNLYILTKQLCEFLSEKYEGIKFTGHSEGEIHISWEE